MTKTVIIEQMKPERKLIGHLKYTDNGLTLEQVTDKVYSDLYRRMYQIWKRNPEMTELRWEYEGVGQGHYISLSDFSKKPSSAWVGKLNYDQMAEVLKRAVEIEDWRMAEDVSYQLRLNQDVVMESSWCEFEIPYRYYNFDWMDTSDDDETPLTDEFMNDFEEQLADEQDDESVIISMVPDLEPDDEYYKLAMAVRRRQVGFESAGGQWVINPFYDETLRDRVDPIVYYGYSNLKVWLD